MKVNQRFAEGLKEIWEDHIRAGNPTYLEIQQDWRELLILLEKHSVPSALANVILNDWRFRFWPASQQGKDGKPGKHHYRLGGLLRHTLEVLRYVDRHANEVGDPIIMVLAALWHDCGKLLEYDLHFASDGCSFGFCTRTTFGDKIPHMTGGIAYVGAHWDSLVYFLGSPEQAEHFLHCVAAHHGHKSWGSPVVPRTKEALIIHQGDMYSVMLDCGVNPAERDW